MLRGPGVALACLLAGASAAGCAALGPTGDGTSVAYGFHNAGELIDGVRLPVRGDGYLIPGTWARRGLHYGTEELVALLVRAARRVELEAPGATLYVGDLSPARGGASAWHRSHQTGRDADLIFFAVDEAGHAAPPPAGMLVYGPDGMTATTDRAGKPLASPPPPRRFDVARNWALVKALLEDPAVDVQYLFIADHLESLLVAHAAATGEPEDLIRRAEAVLHQPGDSAPHDDHLHVRIYCPATDRVVGCRERGPVRWFKKSYKYLASRHLQRLLPPPVAEVLVRPFCHFVASSVLASIWPGPTSL